tara:strand:- start:415 stop:660 length:246 start_codon:yes stop_codon:yes gene_type:complete
MFSVDARAAEVPDPSQRAAIHRASQRVHARGVREDRVPVEVAVGRGGVEDVRGGEHGGDPVVVEADDVVGAPEMCVDARVP